MLYLSLVVLIPLSATFIKASQLTWPEFMAILTDQQVLLAFRLSFLASAAAALINGVFGLLVAWVLVRYKFPGRGFLDSMVDLPFALPTAVAGIALCAVYAETGWIGSSLEPLGIKVAYTPLGVIVALIFIGLPFVVRTVQPVLEDLDKEVEEAATSLGASRLQIFVKLIHPGHHPFPADGRVPGLRPRPGRVRFGHFHFRQHAVEDGNRSPHHRQQTGTVRLRRGHGRGLHDAGPVLRPAAFHQPSAEMGRRRLAQALTRKRFP